MTQEVLKLALDALERSVATCFDQYAHQQVMSQPDHFINQAITAIKEALAQPEQEPVAWRAPSWSNLHGKYGYRDFNDPVIDISTGKPSLYNEPLYTHPQRTWVGLTEEERSQLVTLHHGWNEYGKAIEAKLKEKNI